MSASVVRVPVGPSQPSAVEAWIDDAGKFLLPVALKVVHTLHVVRSARRAPATPNEFVVQISPAR
jgi:hypothetical protein